MASNEEIAKARKSYEEAFGSGGSGCVRQCACGMTFFNETEGWDWEDGELEELRKWKEKGEAIELEWSVGTVFVDGKEHVWDCECWKVRADRITAWLLGNREMIAEFFKLERARRMEEAEKFAANMEG